MKQVIPILFFFLLHFLAPQCLNAQNIPIGQWRDGLPYAMVNCITEGDNRIYASTPYAIFYYDIEDRSAVRITKINGLSDIGISTINFNKSRNTLVIAYTNANIDVIRNGRIHNISDIKRKQILLDKTISDITFIDQYAYLSCGFGIVVLDLDKLEIRDTYYIGANGSPLKIYGLVKTQEDSLFAATEKGIYKAWYKSPNLANYATWRRDLATDTSAYYSSIAYFAGKVFTVKKRAGAMDTICYYTNGKWTSWIREVANPVMKLRSMYNALLITYNYFVHVADPDLSLSYIVWTYAPGNPFPLDAIKDSRGHIWVGDTYSGLIDINVPNNTIAHINLSGPLTFRAFSLTASGDAIYVAPGGRDASYVPMSVAGQIYHFTTDSWINIQGSDDPILATCNDIVTIAVDPVDPKRVYAGSFGRGLLELYNDSVIRRYTESNSTLRHHSAADTGNIRVGGTAFDRNGNLWVVTSHTNSCLSMKRGNEWTGFTIDIVDENDLGNMIIDRYGQKWIIMRYGNLNPNSLLVFTENGTPNDPSDDKARKLNTNPGNGNIPGNIVFAMAEDLDGEIWVGTEKGIAVFYTPENIFSGENFDAQRILVEQDGYVQYLLENETVTAITVDGNNQKWIGTDRGGVFLFSPDGTRQILHFTADNSPLLSDRITSIAINKSGEVFFGTDKGIISYRATATPGGEEFENVYAFPNPVREDYNGYIAIKGLVTSAEVRITDATGNLVYATRAEGGQAIWNGQNFNGKKVKSGVYLVFASNESGSTKIVTKILVIN